MGGLHRITTPQWTLQIMYEMYGKNYIWNHWQISAPNLLSHTWRLQLEDLKNPSKFSGRS